jgi:predicted nucleic acid-binding protein
MTVYLDAKCRKLKVPDCIHLATAIEHKCDLFLTNDVALRRCTQITVEILS